MRPLLHCFLGIVLHIVVSLALGFGVFAYGMASFNGGGAKESKFLLKSLQVWHAPYAFFWKPISEKFLPAMPPARETPKDGDQEGWRVYELHQKETRRIAGIHTSVKNLGVLFSTLVGGYVIGSLYGFATRRKLQANPTDTISPPAP
jgi:hypothetical protein